MKVTIEITEQEIKDLKRIRNYFGEHDVTMLEHLAYSELDKLVKKLTIPNVVGRSEQLPCDHVYRSGFDGKKSFIWCAKCNERF